MRILTVALMLASTSAFSFELSGSLVTAESDFLRENAGNVQKIAEGAYRISTKDGSETHTFGKPGLEYELRVAREAARKRAQVSEADISHMAFLESAIDEMSTASKSMQTCGAFQYELSYSHSPYSFGGGTARSSAMIEGDGFGPRPPGEPTAYARVTIYNGDEVEIVDSDSGDPASAASVGRCDGRTETCRGWEIYAQIYAPACGYRGMNRDNTKF